MCYAIIWMQIKIAQWRLSGSLFLVWTPNESHDVMNQSTELRKKWFNGIEKKGDMTVPPRHSCLAVLFFVQKPNGSLNSSSVNSILKLIHKNEWCEEMTKVQKKNSSHFGMYYQFPHRWHWMRYYSGQNACDKPAHTTYSQKNVRIFLIAQEVNVPSYL